ncbi:DUF1801 domain-containing protein [Draconibacterium sp. IB214405]|uniref:iron chaperone n=1 Tax=Draconibacterium sp. IB214405 TaxID=3097352 RepID=UPI002A0C7FEF|nr:DUF1801 domain-containing protein [Draconibacterium sp. IB214405]MDX8338913.1 DUF1801 domain-containing protein [Draconibacterium sp. IB214405]
MSNFETIEAYINSFDGPAKVYLEQLRALIQKNVPDTTELINYNIAAFTLVDGGKRDEQLMIAGFKNHVGFYPHPATMEHFWEQLKDFKKGKGSVQFPLNKPLPEKLITEMIRYRLNLLTNE